MVPGDAQIARRNGRRRALLLCLALIAVVVAVYGAVAGHTFFILDRNDHVTENRFVAEGLTLRNVAWAFTSVAAFNWHPVTWLSHMTVAELFGMHPGAHHLANVLIHALSSAVLFLLFQRLTGAQWRSFMVAALFALHPLHVESVAWVAERKDVLSAFFWFTTLWCYAEYATRDRKRSLYLLSLGLFILGLMSKSMVVTLPVVMLLMDFWPLGRYGGEQRGTVFGRVATLCREKVPFFACSLITGLITIYAQSRGGATKSFEAVPPALRVENGLVSYVKYILKTVWPVDLGVLYPLPELLPFWQVAGSLFLLVTASATVIRWGRRFPYLPVGWFWFLVTLLPVIGLIQVGSQSMADRYTYLPAIGLFIIAAWGGADLVRGVPGRAPLLAAVGCAVVAASAVLTWRQVGFWRDSVSILQHTLDVTPGNYLVNDLLGIAFAEKGDLAAALRQSREAVRIQPRDPKVRANLAIILSAQGELDAAVAEFRAALQHDPANPRIHNLLGETLAEKGDLDAAIASFREALRLNPNQPTVRGNLEAALDQKRRGQANAQ